MIRPIIFYIIFVLLIAQGRGSPESPESLAFVQDTDLNSRNQWPQWRGPLGTGVAPNGNPPVTWSEDRNIRWKRPIPGKGHSSPIIWGDRIFLTTAIALDEIRPPPPGLAPGAHDNLPSTHLQEFLLLALDRHDGTILWQRTLRREQPHEGAHVTGSWASNSAVTDGEHVFAFFGSRGLYCLDLHGELLWQEDFGDMQSRHGHGEGSSPALHGDTLLINWDHQGESFVVALDKKTGAQRWKVMRDEMTSWSTPIIVEHEGRHQVIISATKRVRAYDFVTGEVIWECKGLSRNVVATPVAEDGWVVVTCSYDHQAMLGIRLADARGDITQTDAIAWRLDRHTPYVPSPLLYDGMLFFLRHNEGVITCLNAKTGKPFFGPRRLHGIHSVYASPVGAAGRVYIVSRDGATAVMKRDAAFELMAINRLDDSFSASPAVVGDAIYLRGQRHLYCIEGDDEE